MGKDTRVKFYSVTQHQRWRKEQLFMNRLSLCDTVVLSSLAKSTFSMSHLFRCKTSRVLTLSGSFQMWIVTLSLGVTIFLLISYLQDSNHCFHVLFVVGYDVNKIQNSHCSLSSWCSLASSNSFFSGFSFTSGFRSRFSCPFCCWLRR